MLDALSRIATTFRTRVGESLATVEQHSTPLVEATTSSLDALKAYSTGMSLSSAEGNGRGAAAVQACRRDRSAVRDGLCVTRSDARRCGRLSTRPLESTTRAYQLRDRTSARERFYIAASYDLYVTGNLEKARQTWETVGAHYPREVDPLLNPGRHSSTPTFGQFDKGC